MLLKRIMLVNIDCGTEFDSDLEAPLESWPFSNKMYNITLVEENRSVRGALSARLNRYPEVNRVESLPYLPTTPAELMHYMPTAVLMGFPQTTVHNRAVTLSHVNYLSQQNVVVIGLVPYVYISEKQEFINSGGAGWLLKTIDSDQIMATIKKYTAG